MASAKAKAKSAQGISWTSNSVDETRALAQALGRLLQAGDVLALHGELGSGKTTFVQGLAQGLGIQSNPVKSPTFVLVREYAGNPSVTHIDAYRLAGAPQAAWLDVEQLIKPEAITVVEWAERLESLLPDKRIDVQLEHVTTNRRRISVQTETPRSKEAADALLRAVPQTENKADETPTGESDAVPCD